MTRKSPHELVMEWHRTYNVPVGKCLPDLLSLDREELRYELIKEEFEELQDALDRQDFIEIVDALADLVYVIYGFAIEMGVDLDNVLQEVQRSNMSKLGEDGKPIFREDGKVLKGPNFSAPDLSEVINSQPPLQ